MRQDKAKIMKAPDKIYVLPEVASIVKVLDEEVEYIRKDALLEWAKSFTEPKIFVSTLIEKLNEM